MATSNTLRALAGEIGRFVAAGIVLAAAPLARVHAATEAVGETSTWHQAIVLAVVVTIALSVLGRVGNRFASSLGALAVAAGAAIVMNGLQGHLAAAWLAGSALVAAWGIHRIRPLPIVPAPTGSATLPLLLLAVLAWRVSGVWDVIPALGLALTAVMPVAVALSIPSRPTRAARRALWRVALALWWVVGWPVAVVVLVVPWAVQRLVRWDGFARHSPGTWVDRDPSGSTSGRWWQSPLRRPRLAPGPALHGRVAAALSVLAVVAIGAPIAGLVRDTSDRLPRPT